MNFLRNKWAKKLGFILLLAFFATGVGLTALAEDICAVCGQPINGQIYLMKDEVTGKTVEVCSNCMMNLPLCYLCGLPIKAGEETALPDGRYLCARDAKTVVLDQDQARQVCADVKDELDHIYSRFTSYPTNVNVVMIDKIDENDIFKVMGHDFESPDLLGVTEPITDDGPKHYKIGLMMGLPLSELKETCAHEYTHTWVGENVPEERHRRLDRDAEEGFCEMMGYLLMDSEQDEAEKARVLANHYTRGQVQLFIQAEQQYGFEDVLDWMRYGVTSRLEADHLDEIRDIRMPANTATAPATSTVSYNHRAAPAVTPALVVPTSLKLQGIMWGAQPVAIINGHSFFLNDVSAIKLGGSNVTIQCTAIQHSRAHVKNLTTGQEQDLDLPAN